MDFNQGWETTLLSCFPYFTYSTSGLHRILLMVWFAWLIVTALKPTWLSSFALKSNDGTENFPKVFWAFFKFFLFFTPSENSHHENWCERPGDQNQVSHNALLHALGNTYILCLRKHFMVSIAEGLLASRGSCMLLESLHCCLITGDVYAACWT